MAPRRNTLPLAAMEKILKQSGADRVSEDAKQALQEVLEDYALELGKRAAKFSMHANRKTVKGSDIKLAAKE
jgi:histone H3/H4